MVGGLLDAGVVVLCGALLGRDHGAAVHLVGSLKGKWRLPLVPGEASESMARCPGVRVKAGSVHERILVLGARLGVTPLVGAGEGPSWMSCSAGG